MPNWTTWVAAACLGVLAVGCDSEKEQISHRTFRESHAYNIGQRRIVLNDKERKRPIKMDCWYPTPDTTGQNISAEYPFIVPPTSFEAEPFPGKFPLILLSHGTGGNRVSLFWLASELVGHGYVVVAVDHFGNTYDNKIPEQFVRVWERPLDIQFALDHLLEEEFTSQLIDTTKVGMVGFSLGGYTAIALAGGKIDFQALKAYAATVDGKNEFDTPEMGDLTALLTEELINEGLSQRHNLTDDRIQSFIALAPVLGQGFPSKNNTTGITSPLFIVGATLDDRARTTYNAVHYASLIDHATYKEIDAGHYVFLNVAEPSLARAAPTFYRDPSGVDRALIHHELAGSIRSFLDSTLAVGK